MSKAKATEPNQVHSPGYEQFVSEAAPLLLERWHVFGPIARLSRFSIQEIRRINPQISYRKLNVWESKQLIDPARKTEDTGWRKFSINETVLLLVIDDLMRMGLSSDLVRKLVEKITCEISHKHDFKLFENWLEFAVFHSWTGKDMYLAVFLDGNAEIGYPGQLCKRILERRQIVVPFVYVPFADYTAYICEILDIPITIQPATALAAIDRKIRPIFRAIERNDFEEITIKRANGESYSWQVKRTKRGDFTEHDIKAAIAATDFQEITLSLKNGKIVTVQRSEIFRAGR